MIQHSFTDENGKRWAACCVNLLKLFQCLFRKSCLIGMAAPCLPN